MMVSTRFGVKPEHLGHASREIILGHRRGDRDSGQLQARRLFAEDIREEPIPFEKVAKRSVRVRGPRKKPRRRYTAPFEYRLAKTRSREEPDCAISAGKQRLDEVR